MATVGVLYLVFERNILKQSGFFVDSIRPANSLGSRTLIGAQVMFFFMYIQNQANKSTLQIGLVILSVIVTRSSILSLQAKVGLPKGNQIVGWLVVGKCRYSLIRQSMLTSSNSFIPHHAFSASSGAKQSLSTPFGGHISDVRAYLCHTYHIL